MTERDIYTLEEVTSEYPHRGLEELNTLWIHKRRVPRLVTRVRPQGI